MRTLILSIKAPRKSLKFHSRSPEGRGRTKMKEIRRQVELGTTDFDCPGNPPPLSDCIQISVKDHVEKKVVAPCYQAAVQIDAEIIEEAPASHPPPVDATSLSLGDAGLCGSISLILGSELGCVGRQSLLICGGPEPVVLISNVEIPSKPGSVLVPPVELTSNAHFFASSYKLVDIDITPESINQLTPRPTSDALFLEHSKPKEIRESYEVLCQPPFLDASHPEGLRRPRSRVVCLPPSIYYSFEVDCPFLAIVVTFMRRDATMRLGENFEKILLGVVHPSLGLAQEGIRPRNSASYVVADGKIIDAVPVSNSFATLQSPETSILRKSFDKALGKEDCSLTPILSPSLEVDVSISQTPTVDVGVTQPESPHRDKVPSPKVVQFAPDFMTSEAPNCASRYRKMAPFSDVYHPCYAVPILTPVPSTIMTLLLRMRFLHHLVLTAAPWMAFPTQCYSVYLGNFATDPQNHDTSIKISSRSGMERSHRNKFVQLPFSISAARQRDTVITGGLIRILNHGEATHQGGITLSNPYAKQAQQQICFW
ncbi:hypothetical protein Nepgr_031296 [Nepenthes gracilis]|uniref:Uncharacterized protein n=1 Tax=Nepenthes gracilis TaxID=150966 RepID=A0AAD3TI67_NEPGR|nr:hypothetical protein Nepgr_031296 [Nepenthes gracilis]